MQSNGVTFSFAGGGLTTAGIEVVLFTTPLVSVPKETVSIYICGMFTCVTGVGTTQVTLLLRRGATTSSPSLVGSWNIDIGASVAGVFPINWSETIVNFAQVQYSLCALTTGSSGGSSTTRGAITAFFMA